MITTAYDILKLVGALVLFLFGMKVMSSSLQRLAGVRLKNILAVFTSNRWKGLLTGLLLTGLIQSSSATTVMTISFVNAGLLNLVQSIGIILGANIGTTLTAWFVSWLGFSIKLSLLALPVIGLSAPLLFSKHLKRQYLGEFILGFSLIFVGLDFIKNIVPDVSQNPEMLNFIRNYTDHGFYSVLFFLFIGLATTAVIQSSSVAATLTIVMSYKGWIDFPLAAAMILGENIGTTITANLAALVGNRNSKQAAFSHLLVNLIGVVFALLFYSGLLGISAKLTSKLYGSSPIDDFHAIPFGLAMFHSLFNLINVGILIHFVRPLRDLIVKIIPDKPADDDEYNIQHISTGLMSTSELSVINARRALINYARHVEKMFILIKKQFNETNEKQFQDIHQSVNHMEEISDKMELEIAKYLTKISGRDISKEGSMKIRLLFKLVNDLESIGDVCKSISKTLKRKKKKKIWFPQDLRNNVNELFVLLEKSLKHGLVYLKTEQSTGMSEAHELRHQIVKTRKRFLKEHLDNIEKGMYTYQAGVIYTDILNHCSMMSDNIINVTEAIHDYNA